MGGWTPCSPSDRAADLFYSPCFETPKNAIKKIEQNNRGRGKKTEGKKKTFFVTSPDCFVVDFFSVF
jgi:hypothetical protein